MNDFRTDDLWQKSVRDEVLVPGFYGKYATDGRYVMIDKGNLASQIQRDFAVDTIAQGRDGSAVCIEEKIVRWKGRPYTAFFLETKSCTVPGREKTGWMFYGRADFLLYCFHQEDGGLDAWLIDFPKLQKWFWPIADTFPASRMSDKNRTEGRVVPIDGVSGGVPTKHYTIPGPAGRTTYRMTEQNGCVIHGAAAVRIQN